MSSSRVLLTTLSIRTSAAGRHYLSGYLGKARVVAFTGEPDKWGNETWDVYLSEPEPRDASRAPSREAASGRTPSPQSTGGLCQDGSRYRVNRQSQRARQVQATDEVAREYCAERLDDEIPF